MNKKTRIFTHSSGLPLFFFRLENGRSELEIWERRAISLKGLV